MKILKSFILIVGTIWMPQSTCAQRKDLSQSDIEQMTDDDGNVTRESVEQWVNTNSGDFSKVIDFYADIETGKGNIIIEWNSEDNEITFEHCMYGEVE